MPSEVVLQAGDARAVVDPATGARVASLVADDLELLVTEPPPGSAVPALEWGLFPMAPWAGRLRDGRFTFAGTTHELPRNDPPDAIHGTVFDAAFDVAAADDRAVTMTAALDEPWPYPGRVVHHVGLGHEQLDLRLEVHADGAPMPVSAGWHPWLRRRLGRGGQVEVDIDAGAMYRRDDGGLPTGELVDPAPPPWDDCFTDLRHPPVLRWAHGLTLVVTSSAHHVVVFTERDHAVCVEPQTGPPDALNLAPVLVRPDRPLVVTASLHWRVL